MRRLALIVGLICLFPFRLTGAVSLNQPPMEWLEPTTLEQQTALAARPDYQSFLESAPGPWSAEFDPVLMTPRARSEVRAASIRERSRSSSSLVPVSSWQRLWPENLSVSWDSAIEFYAFHDIAMKTIVETIVGDGPFLC